MDEEPKAPPKKEPEWKSFSVLRVPVNQGDADTSARPVNDAVTDAVVVRPVSHSTVAGQVALPLLRLKTVNKAAQCNRHCRRSTSPSRSLAHYQTDQFDGTARPAPVEAFTPKVETARTNSHSSCLGAASSRSAPIALSRVPRTPRPIRQCSSQKTSNRMPEKWDLYLARNPEHWDGLFKVGQTIIIRVGESRD